MISERKWLSHGIIFDHSGTEGIPLSLDRVWLLVMTMFFVALWGLWLISKAGKETVAKWSCVQPGDATHIVARVLDRLGLLARERKWLYHGIIGSPQLWAITRLSLRSRYACNNVNWNLCQHFVVLDCLVETDRNISASNMLRFVIMWPKPINMAPSFHTEIQATMAFIFWDVCEIVLNKFSELRKNCHTTYIRIYNSITLSTFCRSRIVQSDINPLRNLSYTQ